MHASHGESPYEAMISAWTGRRAVFLFLQSQLKGKTIMSETKERRGKDRRTGESLRALCDRPLQTGQN